jgi:hypothetical protein
MTIQMKREEFEALDDRALVWACVEPIISRIRGRSPDIKSGVYQTLTPDQQALVLFQIYYGHSRSAAELYWFTCEYLSQPELWGRIKETVKARECRALWDAYILLERRLLTGVEKAKAEGRVITVLDLDRDKGLVKDMNGLLEVYRLAAQDAIRQWASLIRSNPGGYMKLEE